jgi:hypothetical protein
MQASAIAAWAWIPIVLWAAFAQTIRNATQRTLVAGMGTLAATLVRFLYGLPFAATWLLLVHADHRDPCWHRCHLSAQTFAGWLAWAPGHSWWPPPACWWR